MLAAGETLNVVLPPSQKLALPVTTGVFGKGVTVTSITLETADVQPLEIARTENEPAANTVMLLSVTPLLHKYVVLAAGLATLNVVAPPVQKLELPEIVGVFGKGVTVTFITLETAEVQPAEIARTENEPAAKTSIVLEVTPLLHK